jgi:hypothetical protein
MSETPWTPGRWSADHNRPPDEGVAVASDHNFTTNTGKTYRKFVAQFCDAADARLIAAAPELAEALQEVMECFGPGTMTDSTYEKACAALAKAKGETP